MRTTSGGAWFVGVSPFWFIIGAFFWALFVITWFTVKWIMIGVIFVYVGMFAVGKWAFLQSRDRIRAHRDHQARLRDDVRNGRIGA